LRSVDKLIFVHNADSGYLSALVDGLHKSLKPSTYKCDLCALTYGVVKMKGQWKDFIKNLPVPVEITYKDKFVKDYPNQKNNPPAVLSKANGSLKLEISAKQFSEFDELDDLIKAVRKITLN